VAGGGERGIDHRHYRPLAVGARDVNGTERTLGMAERGDEGPHVVEPELDAELLEPEQPVERGSAVRIQ
jgi:hypothetical protein